MDFVRLPPVNEDPRRDGMLQCLRATRGLCDGLAPDCEAGSVKMTRTPADDEVVQWTRTLSWDCGDPDHLDLTRR